MFGTPVTAVLFAMEVVSNGALYYVALIPCTASVITAKVLSGLLGMFCAMVNCPVASIILGVELFGGDALLYYCAVCTVSYALSGLGGLYGTQKILYSKLRAEYIDVMAGDEDPL